MISFPFLDISSNGLVYQYFMGLYYAYQSKKTRSSLFTWNFFVKFNRKI